ncbi:MAG: VWA domain-containing protein [Planctomycetota bacterium]|jgi:Ca-activated chloride channel family protein|nr:MAG: VWA domain-containing protein [Planctomycetota bacterium]
MDSFRFYSSLLLLPGPVAIWLVWFRSRRHVQPAATFSSVADLKTLPVTWMQRVRRTFPWLYGLALLLIIAGLARPQAGKSESRITGEGIAVELVLDISGSMEALDFQLDGDDVSRLEAVRHVIGQFVLGSKGEGLSGRPDDLIGLVAFGGFADSKCPLTLDHGALVDIVDSLKVPKPVRDQQGRIINADALQEELATAIGDGVALGIDRLKDSKAKSKVLVLLTDGDNNAGVVDPREAATIAKELGIKIYSIGIGRNGVVPVPQEDEFGRTVLVPAQFRIDEELLREIATITGGTYFHASDSEALTEVYAQIDRLEKSQFEESKYSEYTELFRWFAGSGLALVLAINVLKETRFRSLP